MDLIRRLRTIRGLLPKEAKAARHEINALLAALLPRKFDRTADPHRQHFSALEMGLAEVFKEFCERNEAEPLILDAPESPRTTYELGQITQRDVWVAARLFQWCGTNYGYGTLVEGFKKAGLRLNYTGNENPSIAAQIAPAKKRLLKTP